MTHIESPYAGADWIKKSVCDSPSPLGVRVADLLGVFARGIYHIEEKQLREMEWTNMYSIFLRWSNGLATHDMSDLSTLVVLAHDMGVRIRIAPAPYLQHQLWIIFRPQSNLGHMTIEERITEVRALYRKETS